MPTGLQVGLRYQHRFLVPASKTVPALYPEAEEFVQMPQVFATGFMVGFLEWACIRAINPYLDWPNEQSVGTHINVSHQAATPVGAEVVADVELIQMDGRRLLFAVTAHDGLDVIAQGTHERFVIDRQRFESKLAHKQQQLPERT
jgi:fluoroacetyl-CoA thioesterase